MAKPIQYCFIEGCGIRAYAYGLCRNHDRNQRLYGNPLLSKQVQYHGLTVAERFWKRVKQGDGCWLWLGSRDKNGYGRMRLNGRPELVTHIAWQLTYGALPKGQVILHVCDNPPCVNPDHLRIGTQQDNIADMHNKERARQGHALGVEHGLAKLNPDRVREIRASHETTLQLSKRLGIARATIDAVKKRQTWRHVE